MSASQPSEIVIDKTAYFHTQSYVLAITELGLIATTGT